MNDSILSSVKKYLGIPDDYTHFDEQIIMAINAAFMALNQLGVGADPPFTITGNSELWSSFIGTGEIEAAKIYVPLKVRLLFDPPQSSYLVNEIKDQLSEIEFRMLVQAERPLLPEADMSGIYIGE